jgi:hypothetical protein
VVVEVYWALALVEPFKCLLQGMLFVVVARGGGVVGEGRLRGMGMCCVRGVIVWLVVGRRISVVIGLVFGTGVGVLV